MKVCIITHYGRLSNENGNSRFNYLARLLKNNNYEVEIITTSFLHGEKRQRDIKEMDLNKDGYKVTLIKEPGYNKNISLKRLYSHYVMSINLKKYLSNLDSKPDVIYCAVPSLDVAKVAAKYAKKNNIRFIIDVQDLWPEAFKMVFKLPVIKDVLFYPFQRKANYIYKNADDIVAVSETYANRAAKVNKKYKNKLIVYLGTDLEIFDKYKNSYTNAFDEDKIKIVYIGTLGHSYNIKIIIDALKILNSKYDNLKFIIMGDGPLKMKFQEYAKQQKVDCDFTGRLDYSEMVAKLSKCDIAVNPISSGAAQSIINKVGDYAAAGLPVINTQENQEYRKIVEEYDIGINCKNNDSEDVAKKIEILINNIKLRKEMGKNNRRLAEERFDRKKSYENIINIIKNKEEKVIKKSKVKNIWYETKGFIKDMFFNTFSFALYIIAQQIILMPAMSRFLSQEAYANYIIYISVFAIISNVLGKELGVVRQVKNDKYAGKYYNRILVMLIPIILVSSSVILYILKYSIIEIIFLTISILLANIRLYSASYFRTNKEFKKVLMQNVIYLITLIIGLVLYKIYPYIWIPSLIAEICTFVYSLFNTDFIKEGISKTNDKEIVDTFKNLGFISFLVNGIVYFDKILIYPILGGAAVTLYYATSSMSKIINLIVNPLYSVILSWLKENDEKFKSKILTLTIKINVPIVILTFIISVPLTYIALKILYPQYFESTMRLVIPICVGLAFSVATSLVKAILLKYMESKMLVRAYIIYFIIFLSTAIIMSKLFGLLGFVYSNVISKFSLWILFLFLLKNCNMSCRKSEQVE